MTADLLYDNRPCHRIRRLKYENSRIEKSEAKDAYLPSFPTIPIPTFASKIIPTSFPPSPTAAVLLPVYRFISLTINAFYVGLHLHTQTLGANVAVVKNFCSRPLLDKNKSKVYPSIIRIRFSAFC